MMRHDRLYIHVLIAILGSVILQSCYVQKNSETHATIIYDAFPELTGQDDSNEMVTVEENQDASRSLEALSASVLLIDFQKQQRPSRWEDNLSYSYSKTEAQPTLLVEEHESTKSVIIKN